MQCTPSSATIQSSRASSRATTLGAVLHNLNAPGKFLVSALGHDRPKRARAYLLTDQAVTETAAHYSGYRPELDAESLRAVSDAANAHPGHDGNPDSESGSPGAGEPSGRQPTMAEQSLWMALVMEGYSDSPVEVQADDC